jgi:hypothetical protein
MLNFEENIHGEELSDIWRYLMMNKKMYKIYSCNQYDMTNCLERNEDELAILDWLNDMGYVEKRELKMHVVSIDSEYSLLKPSLFPFGYFSLNGDTRSDLEQHTFDEDEFKIFRDTFIPIKKEIDAKRWRHIEDLDMYILYSYNNIRYEVKDVFFDAIYVDWDHKEKKTNITLVEPFFNSKSGSKNWRKIRELPTISFVSNSENIKKEIEELDWKKKIRGIIALEGKCYFLKYQDITKSNIEIMDILIDVDLSELPKAIEEYDNNRSKEYIYTLAREISKLRELCNNASMQIGSYMIFRTTDKTINFMQNLAGRVCANEDQVSELADEMHQSFKEAYNKGQNVISVANDEVLDAIYKLRIRRDHDLNQRKSAKNFNTHIGKIYKRFTKTSVPNTPEDWFIVQVGLMLSIKSFLDGKLKIISAIGSSNSNIIK